ncbi:MAG: hypothetical protein ACI8R4_000635 [Paracoccaceae bacterium]|jgi:hypothetical protein
MTHIDLTLDDIAPPRRNRALRLILMVLMTLCGLMMTAILLSDPRVSATLGVTPDHAPTQAELSQAPRLGSLNDLTEATGLPPLGASSAQAAAAQPATEPTEPVVRPTVSVMPTNRIPVRRAGN